MIEKSTLTIPCILLHKIPLQATTPGLKSCHYTSPFPFLVRMFDPIFPTPHLGRRLIQRFRAESSQVKTGGGRLVYSSHSTRVSRTRMGICVCLSHGGATRHMKGNVVSFLGMDTFDDPAENY